jgi:hypothetical protein
MYPKNQNFFTRQHINYIFTKEEGGVWPLQNLAISFIIRRRELNIKLLDDKVGQIFNFKLSLLDGLQVVVIIDFLPKFFQRGHWSKNSDMCQDILDARLDPSLDKALETLRDQRDEGTPTTPFIFRSPEKLGDGLERFP